MIRVDAGSFIMGYEGPDSFPEDGEGPKRKVELDSFYLDQTTVTNLQFSKFIEETDYVTDSEKNSAGLMFVGQLKKSTIRKLDQSKLVKGLQWWVGIEGAY